MESFFEPARLVDLEDRLGLPPEGLTPGNAVVYICGLTGTIRATVLRLIDRGFVPDGAIRDALGVPPAAGHSLFYEHYDTEPVIDIGDPPIVQPLRERMQAALAKL